MEGREAFMMSARKLWIGVLVVILVAGLPGLALAALSGVTYTGPLFSAFGGNPLSAQVQVSPVGEPVPPLPVIFQGKTLWGSPVGAGPVLCDGFGEASTIADWPPGVYRFLTVAQDFPVQVTSVEQALTIYSKNIRGVACGGEVGLGPIPTRSTVGFIYQNMYPLYVPPTGSGVLTAPYANLRTFLVDVDPEVVSQYPAYSIWTTDFKKVSFYCSGGAVRAVELQGKCYFQQAFTAPRYVNFSAVFDFGSSPDGTLFTLRVWRQTLTSFDVLVNDENRLITNGGFFVKTL
jgi:hypothetical protein